MFKVQFTQKWNDAIISVAILNPVNFACNNNALPNFKAAFFSIQVVQKAIP